MKTTIKLWFLFAGIVLSASCTSNYQNDDDVSFQRAPEPSLSEYRLHLPYSSNDIGKDLAQSFASKYVPSGGSDLRSISIGKAIRSIQAVCSTQGDTLLYAINYEPRGYVLLSAKRDCSPILAQSSTGTFDVNSKSSITQYWLEECKAYVETSHMLEDSIKQKHYLEWDALALNSRLVQAEQLRSADNPADIDQIVNLYLSTIYKAEKEGYSVYTLKDFERTSLYSKLTAERPYENTDLNQFVSRYASRRYPEQFQSIVLVKNRVNIEKYTDALLKTTWGQAYGYNQFVPQYTPLNPFLYPIGCVATAVGQIMYHHKYPKQYKWGDMELHYPTEASAKLLYDIALAVHMQFGSIESIAYDKDALSCFNNWGYKSARLIKSFDQQAIQNDLKKGLPVYMRANSSPSSGHAFVVDAYEYLHSKIEIKLLVLEDAPHPITPSLYHQVYSAEISPYIRTTYHVNMGWDGAQDEYYDDDVLSNEQNNQLRRYRYNRQIFVNIKPN